MQDLSVEEIEEYIAETDIYLRNSEYDNKVLIGALTKASVSLLATVKAQATYIARVEKMNDILLGKLGGFSENL